MCSTILHHDIEEIKYHLSEIVSLKEIEIMEARRKAAEREEQEQAKQIAQEEQIKNRHLILKLSKQIRYFAKRGKLGNLTNFLAKFQGRFKGLINNKSSKGCTALHWAAARGHEEVINQLINSGADPTITTDYGQKPADLSRIRSLRVKLLEEAEKWEQRDEIPTCRKNQFHPISVKQQQNPSDVEIASNEFIKLPGLYDEMHDYIFSLKKLKNDKINELITKYCNLQTCLQ